MDLDSEIAADLARLQRQWEEVSEQPERPRSTMDVIEDGLGKQRRAEVYVNRLLCYLLDPEQPHQMGTDFLETFLTGLPAAAGFDEDTYALGDVRVRQQVPVWDAPSETRAADVSPGYLDLLLDVPNEWSLLVELKFSADESGTEFYCAAEAFGDHRVSDYESGQYYLYLHQRDRPEARGECFVNWTWQAFVEEILSPFVAEQTPRYPQRTVTQLHDLTDDINRIVGMTDNSDSIQQKVALYLEHADAITDVNETFEREWEAYSDRWGQDLQDTLTHTRVQPTTGTDDGHPAVTVDRVTSEPERWLLRDSGGDWQHVFKHGWWQQAAKSQSLETRADDRNDLRIGFYHRMEDNRDLAVNDHKLQFNFRCMGSNPTAFTDLYNDAFESHYDQITDLLEPTRASLTGNKLTLIQGTYPIPLADHETVFDAYTAALEDAFVELVVESPELVQLLGDLYEEAITTYR